MYENHNAPPFNPLPPVIAILALIIGGAEVVFSLAERGLMGGGQSMGWRIASLNALAYSPPGFERMVELATWNLRDLSRLITYPFVNLGFVHSLFVVVILLAVGKMVGEVFASWAVLIVFFGSAIFGALFYTVVLASDIALVGGYTPVYGMIGAYTFILWVGLGAVGENRYRAFTLIALLLGIQLVFGILFGAGLSWVAEIAGFCAGFVLSFFVSPGGWQNVLRKLRQR